VVDSRIFGLLRSARFEFGGLGRILTGGGYSGNSQLAGGGILYQMGVHYIDSLLFISRAKNIAIESGVMEVEDDLDIHTDATLIITVEDDRQVPLELLVTSFRNTNYRIELEFDNATVSFVPAYGAQNLEVSHRSSTILGYLHPTPHHGPLNAHASFAAHWRGVIELVTSRSPNETSASSCRLTTQALELLYSLKNGAV
jgi:predicted dehydrogenase